MNTPTKSPATTTPLSRVADQDSKDEVDYVRLKSNNNHKRMIENEPTTKTMTATTNTIPNTTTESNKKTSTKELLSLFSFSRKLSHKNQQPRREYRKQKQQQQQQTSSNTNNNYIKENESNGHQEARDKPNAATTTTTTTTSAFTYPYQTPTVPIGTPPRQHKFVKSHSSISRLFSNTYNAKTFEKEEQKRLANAGKFHTYGGRHRANGPYLERFKSAAKEEGDTVADDMAKAMMENANTNACSASGTLTRKKRRSSNSCSELATLEPEEPRNEDIGSKALRTLSRGLGKLWWKRTHSVDISTPDPEYKVAYLGNVLTGWAKGEGCVEKQLATLWRNYTQNNKPDVIMRIKVCASGLKATTRQHGLTEYWANRITHCCAPKNYPRVFCWIYRHEGRKLKHELRCHAVLCSKEKIVHEICDTLKENLECALREFKREKILKQNARLSLANAAYDNPSLPRRKILLSVGGNNYRPPLERSKSAPKLMAIEEAIGEEEGDEIEETNEPEMKPCCQRDSLYPAMTLGRRRCRRGHSIRRTGKARSTLLERIESKSCCHGHSKNDTKVSINETIKESIASTQEDQRNSCYGSNDSDDFEKLLKHNDYDSNASLATELLPYFDLQLHKNKSSSLSSLHDLKDVIDEQEEVIEPLSLIPTINTDPNADPEADFNLTDHDKDDEDNHNNNNNSNNNDGEQVLVSLRRPGVCSDGEEDDYLDSDDVEIRYFRQQSILNILHRNSMRKMAQLSLSSDENSSLETHAMPPTPQYRHQLQSSISSNASTTDGGSSITSASGDQHEGAPQQRKQFQADSDEGSISSGCETASTVTTPNQDDLSLQFRRLSNQHHQQEQQDQALFDINGLPLLSINNDSEDLSPVTAEEIYQRLESRRHGRQNSDATTFSSSSSITLKMSNSPDTSMLELNENGNALDATKKLSNGHVARAVRRLRRSSAQRERECESDSECSDESGYVEFQDRGDKRNSKQESRHKNSVTITTPASSSPTKPQPPPKPMPRRHINVNTTTMV